MRSITAIALILVLLLCGAALAETPPGNKLGYKVLSELSKGESNAFVSPVSLAWALSMAAEGAAGETRQKLLSALNLDSTDSLAGLGESLEEAGVHWANAAFVGDGIALKPEYAEALIAKYEAEPFPLTGLEQVADWVREKTLGLIEDLPIDLGPATQLVLVNAIAMEAEWASPFDPNDSYDGDFHAPDGDVPVTYMRQTTYAQYGEGNGVQVMCKAYMNGQLAMYIALPKEGGLKRALNNLAENPNTFFTFKPMPQELSLVMPKMDFSVSQSLLDAIVAAGCWVPFSEKYADYSGISDTELLISDVFQQVRLQVDEEGTRAAAATELVLNDTAALDDGPQPIAFVLDRPFLLAIVDRATGEALFAGAVVNPSAE